MNLILAYISPRRASAKSAPAEVMINDYLLRANRYTPTRQEIFSTEAEFLSFCERDTTRRPARPAAAVLLFDSRGALPTSEEFADTLGRLRDGGTQRIVLAIGPADGWSTTALARASKTISFGRLTLPHELARVLAAEQMYRALTILHGHPYHSGH